MCWMTTLPWGRLLPGWLLSPVSCCSNKTSIKRCFPSSVTNLSNSSLPCPRNRSCGTCADDLLCVFFHLVLLFGVVCLCLSSKWSLIWLTFLWPCSFPRSTGFPRRMPATSNPCTPPPSMGWRTWSAWGTWMRQEFSGTCWFAIGSTSSMWVSTSPHLTSGSALHALLSLALGNPCQGELWLIWAFGFLPSPCPRWQRASDFGGHCRASRCLSERLHELGHGQSPRHLAVLPL